MSADNNKKEDPYYFAKPVEDQVEPFDAHATLHRKLKNRHIAMIRYIST